MKLRVFLPAVEAPASNPPLAWILRDAGGHVLRRERSAIADMPRVEAVEVVLPAERVLFARLKLPRVNAGTVRELLPYAVEDRLLSDPAHIHAVAGPRNARGETLVAVVDREWLGGFVHSLTRNGLRPTSAWCESALLAGGRGDWHVVLDATRGMLVDDDGVAATFDRGPTLPLAIRVALDEAAGRGERPTSVTLHAAGGADLPDLHGWSAEAGLPFLAGGPWDAIEASDPAQDTIDLLHGAWAKPGRFAGTIPRAAVVIAITLVVLQLAFTTIDTFRLRREGQALDSRRESVFREAFPEARVVVDPELQMARNLAQLQRERGLAAGDEFLAAMTRAARDRGTAVKSVDYANGKVSTR